MCVKLYFHSLTFTAVPNISLSELKLIPSTKPRNTDPPEIILSFNAYIAPPTYVSCEVGSSPVNISVLFREVTAGLYLPPNSTSPVTNVTVTLRTRQAGNYQCTVSVFRASGENFTDVKTSLNILGLTEKQNLYEIV